MHTLRRSRAVLHALDPDQTYFDHGHVHFRQEGMHVVETFWKNPELDGVWECRYWVTPKCFERMRADGYLVLDPAARLDRILFRLSPKALKRIAG